MEHDVFLFLNFCSDVCTGDIHCKSCWAEIQDPLQVSLHDFPVGCWSFWPLTVQKVCSPHVVSDFWSTTSIVIHLRPLQQFGLKTPETARVNSPFCSPCYAMLLYCALKLKVDCHLSAPVASNLASKRLKRYQWIPVVRFQRFRG